MSALQTAPTLNGASSRAPRQGGPGGRITRGRITREERGREEGEEHTEKEQRAIRLLVKGVCASARGRTGRRPLFEVARHTVGVDDLRPYARALHVTAELSGTWRDTHTKLLEARAKVLWPANDQLLRSALVEADGLEFPELPGRYTAQMRRLAAWGYVLGRDNAPSPFWMGVRSLAAHFQISYRQAYRLLPLLAAPDGGVFRLVRKGYGRWATTYRWSGPDPSTELEPPPAHERGGQ